MTLYAITAHGRTYQIEAGDDGAQFGIERRSLVGSALATGKPYEPALLEHIYERKLSGVAIDVGAHVGNHTLWLAVICGLKVWAFEPDRPTADKLFENVARSRAVGVVVWPCALGAGTGWAAPVGRGSYRPGVKESRSVPVRTLDSFRIDDVALIKIDVEGMEPDVLHGATATIRRCRPLVCAEHQDQRARLRNTAVLEPLGYVQTHTFGATPMGVWEPISDSSSSSEAGESEA